MTRSRLIGQCLNAAGSRRVARALAARDAAAITAIARRQIAAGADALDLCAAGLEDEAAALQWLIKTVQAYPDLPLALDSAQSDVLRHVLPLCRRPPILNAYSGVLTHPEEFRTLCRDWPTRAVIVLCLDGRGSRTTSLERLEIAQRLADDLTVCGIRPERLIFDPITMPVATAPEAQAVTLETTAYLRRDFPAAHILCVTGNAGYGSADRNTVERECALAAQQAGADTFLCDPLVPGLVPALRR